MYIHIFSTLGVLEIKGRCKFYTWPWKRQFTKVMFSEQMWKAGKTQSHKSPLWSGEKKNPFSSHFVFADSWAHTIPKIYKNTARPNSK